MSFKLTASDTGAIFLCNRALSSTMLIIIFRINFLIIKMLVVIESLINLKQYTDLSMITCGLLMGLHLLSIVSCQTEFHSNGKNYVEFGENI